MQQPRTDRRCPTCSRFPDFTGRDMMHWRACVPRKHWPRFQVVGEVDGVPVVELLPPAERYVVTDDGTLAPVHAPVHACADCGFVAVSAFGLQAHRRGKHEAVKA